MATPETRRQLLAAVAACDDKKGEDTRILELDPADSGLADFFLITSASNDRQVVAIADEIEMRLKKDFGIYASSVEGRRQAEWILLDYVDIVIHVFLAEKRAFYDIERLRKSARNLTSADVEADLESSLAHALAERTRAVRSDSQKAAKKSPEVKPGKSPATKAAKPSPPSAKTSLKGASTVTAEPAKKAVEKAAKPGKDLKAKSTTKAASPAKVAAKPALKSVSRAVGVLAPSTRKSGKTGPVALGAKPPIIKRQIAGPVDGVFADNLGAKPPIVKCEDPDQASVSSPVSIAASAAPATVKASVKKAAKKAPAKPAKKAAAVKAPAKAPAKAAVKTSARKSRGK
jgi:ribosome-associated protein